MYIKNNVYLYERDKIVRYIFYSYDLYSIQTYILITIRFIINSVDNYLQYRYHYLPQILML